MRVKLFMPTVRNTDVEPRPAGRLSQQGGVPGAGHAADGLAGRLISS